MATNSLNKYTTDYRINCHFSLFCQMMHSWNDSIRFSSFEVELLEGERYHCDVNAHVQMENQTFRSSMQRWWWVIMCRCSSVHWIDCNWLNSKSFHIYVWMERRLREERDNCQIEPSQSVPLELQTPCMCVRVRWKSINDPVPPYTDVDGLAWERKHNGVNMEAILEKHMSPHTTKKSRATTGMTDWNDCRQTFRSEANSLADVKLRFVEMDAFFHFWICDVVGRQCFVL